MPNNTDPITLSISVASPAPPGYTRSTNPSIYYRFEGGNDGAGGIIGKDRAGVVNVELRLLAVGIMSIGAVDFFTVDANGTKTPYTGPELEWNPDNQTPVTSGKIKDKMDNVQDYYYSVTVNMRGESPFTCDPPIRNQPPA